MRVGEGRVGMRVGEGREMGDTLVRQEIGEGRVR